MSHGDVFFYVKREKWYFESRSGERNLPDDKKECLVKAEDLKIDSLKMIPQYEDYMLYSSCSKPSCVSVTEILLSWCFLSMLFPTLYHTLYNLASPLKKGNKRISFSRIFPLQMMSRTLYSESPEKIVFSSSCATPWPFKGTIRSSKCELQCDQISLLRW